MFVRLLEFISFDPKSIKAMPLENFKKDPPGLWLIIQNSIPLLKNCLDQHHPDRKNIKSTSANFAYINLQCKLLKDQEIIAKEIENMFTGSSADQQRKDASAARYPTRSTLHSIPDSSNVSSPSAPVTPILDEFPSLPVDDSHEDPDVVPDTADEYSFQDEAEDIASTSYDNSAIADDFNYSNRAVVYQDVLDQPSYVQYCYQHFLYPDLNPSSLSSVSGPAPKLDKKMMHCFQHAKRNCPKKADECQYSHDRVVIKA